MRIPVYIILFFILISTFSVSRQKIDSIKSKLNTKSFEILDKYLTNTSSGNHNVQYSQNLNRQILSSYYEVVITFQETIPTKAKRVSDIYHYKIHVLKSDDKSIYSKIENHQKLKNIKIEAIFSDNVAIKSFQQTYLSIYDRNVKVDDFFKTSIIYGHSCGNTGVENKYRIKQKRFIQSKDIEELEKWLTSPIPEIQVYALEGFYELKKKGYQPTNKQLDLIKLIKSKKGSIQTCYGCIYMAEEIQLVTQKFEF